MVIYSKSAAEFTSDVDNNTIVDELERAFKLRLGWVPSREIAPWTNSLRFMETIIRKADISPDCGVLIEYRIPATSKRIDFILTGEDASRRKNAVIVELKQWQSAKATSMDGVVEAIFSRGWHATAHPSYQAYSYKSLLLDFNENIQTKNVSVSSCAYLHNYAEGSPEPLRAPLYEQIVSDSPLFFKHDTAKLQEFIRKYVGAGKGMRILYEIEKGKIRPSKKLIDHVCEMYKGNPSFTLIDSQKVSYEMALNVSVNATKKTIVIIRGGPGTGKSVLSMNLLGGLLKRSQSVVFVAPNAAFRDVMVRTLAHENQTTRLRHLFKGSGSFLDAEANSFDTIVVDEAHRMKGEGAYQYRGKNQVEDVVKAARCTVFFIDDSQQVRPDDIGSTKEIQRVAKKFGAELHEMELDAQYRCAGADGFLNWLDDVLMIRETANFDGWDRKEFQFEIVDDPNTLHELIKRKRDEGHTARLLAGYAWEWTSEGEGNPNGEVADVVIEEHHFRMPWNSRRARTTWAIDDSGTDQIGCIHTSQGLEFDYVGVIIGPDLEYDPQARSLKGNREEYKDTIGKRGLQNKPEALTLYIKQIYKTLMSRGAKGCFVYVGDPGARTYFKDRLSALSVRYQ